MRANYYFQGVLFPFHHSRTQEKELANYIKKMSIRKILAKESRSLKKLARYIVRTVLFSQKSIRKAKIYALILICLSLFFFFWYHYR